MLHSVTLLGLVVSMYVVDMVGHGYKLVSERLHYGTIKNALAT